MFINFPASCFMTDFEIVEQQNHMIRARRIEEIELAEQTRRTEEQDHKEIEDINIIARVTARLVHDINRIPFISPIHRTPTPTITISPPNHTISNDEFDELPKESDISTYFSEDEDSTSEESEESSDTTTKDNIEDTDTDGDHQDNYDQDNDEENKEDTDPKNKERTGNDTSNSGDSFYSPLSAISPNS